MVSMIRNDTMTCKGDLPVENLSLRVITYEGAMSTTKVNREKSITSKKMFYNQK